MKEKIIFNAIAFFLSIRRKGNIWSSLFMMETKTEKSVFVSVDLEKTNNTPKQQCKDPAWVRRLLIGLVWVWFIVFLIFPVGIVLTNALQKGLGVYLSSLTHPDTLAAMRLSFLTVLVAVPLNVVFGLAAAWAIAKYQFRGKNFLITLIDIPFTVSPVIAGLIFVLAFGAQGTFGTWLIEHNIKIIFAVPGIILATTFVTVPFVAKELIPLMESQGNEEEISAMTLGASGWQTFWHVTLPNIKWGLLYGIILCNARALGEFGAVSVVSGHIRGMTNTLPLHIEILYNEYNFTAAFAAASVLLLLSFVTLGLKKLVDWRTKRVNL